MSSGCSFLWGKRGSKDVKSIVGDTNSLRLWDKDVLTLVILVRVMHNDITFALVPCPLVPCPSWHMRKSEINKRWLEAGLDQYGSTSCFKLHYK